MFQRIIKNTYGLPSNVSPSSLKQPCISCSQGKIIIRPFLSKTLYEIPNFLEQLQTDVCGPRHPARGPFHYFLVLINALSKWSNVLLLSSRNLVFSQIFSHILKLKAQFLENPIKILQVGKTSEFTSKTFDDFYMTLH